MQAFAGLSSSSSSSSDEEEEEVVVEERVEEVEKEGLANAEEVRFRVELEFVQLLASPTYLHYLAQYEYLDDEAFVEYLKYLRYWERPEYLMFIEYPECLQFLKKLTEDSEFRKSLKLPFTRDKLQHDQFYRWRNTYFEMNVLKSTLPEVDDDFGAAKKGLVDEDAIYSDEPVDLHCDLGDGTPLEQRTDLRQEVIDLFNEDKADWDAAQRPASSFPPSSSS